MATTLMPMPTPTPTKPVAALTIGQLQKSHAKKWVFAILSQLTPVGFTAAYVLYAFPGGASFFAGVPWRLALVLAGCAYVNVLFLVLSYADLYLPRTPMAVVRKMTEVGMCIGAAAIGVVVVVMVLHVKDARVLAACTAVAAAFIVGLIAFWVWLSRTYGGDAESEPPTPSGVFPNEAYPISISENGNTTVLI